MYEDITDLSDVCDFCILLIPSLGGRFDISSIQFFTMDIFQRCGQKDTLYLFIGKVLVMIRIINRGITLISCLKLGKLFTSVINQRLLQWDEVNNIKSYSHFKPNMSTIDDIFALQSLVNRTLKNKQIFHCCFVDYKRR